DLRATAGDAVEHGDILQPAGIYILLRDYAGGPEGHVIARSRLQRRRLARLLDGRLRVGHAEVCDGDVSGIRQGEDIVHAIANFRQFRAYEIDEDGLFEKINTRYRIQGILAGG